MSYQVFARKYRPQLFEEVLGQDAAIQTLRNAIRGQRLAHAYLFVGPRGVGKTSTARIFAKALNCVNGPTETPCGTCDSCREIAAGISLDVLEIDGASNNSVDQVRELRENVRFLPTRGKFRIYLIDEVHMLSGAAFNALLKTLEEPPAHVKFFFATTEAHKLPATIISRCQRFDLRPIRDDVVAKHLLLIAETEKVMLEAAAADVIARAAEGGMRDAESMLDQVVSFCGDKISENDVLTIFGFTSAEDVAGLAGFILAGDTAAALDLVAAQSESGKDLGRLLADLVSLARDLLVSEATGRDLPGRRGQLLAPLRGKFSARKLTEMLEILSTAEAGLRFSPDKKLPLEIAVVKSIQLLQTADLDEVLAALAAVQSGKPLPPSSPAPLPRPVMKPRSASPAVPIPAITTAPSSTPKVTEETQPAVPAKEEVPTKGEEDASKVWADVVAEISKRQKIRSKWLEQACEVKEEGNALRVTFPETLDKQLRTLTAEEQGKLIQELWLQMTGRRIVFRPEATASSPVAASAPDPVLSIADNFENDPGIEAAVELFGATLESEKS